MKATQNAAVYRPHLGSAVMEFYNTDITDFIGLQVMPIYPTPDIEGSFPLVPKEALLNVPDTSRAPRGDYKEDDFEYERCKYRCSEYGWKERIDDVERSMFDRESPSLAGVIATQRAMGILLRSQEKRIANMLFNSTNFSAHAVTTEWDTPATATPIDDVNDGISAFRSQCGMKPDALIISYTTFRDLKVADQVVDQIKYTFPGIDIMNMGANQLAQLFGIPRVIVAGGVYNSAGKGIDATIADIWSYEYAMLVKIGNGRDLMQPCVGRTFLWSEDSPDNAVVEQYRDEDRRCDIYRVRQHVAETLLKSYDNTGTVVSNVAAACGYLMSNIHT